MTTPSDVLTIATRHLGYKEVAPGINQNKFGDWYGMNFQPWCAMFVSYCFYNARLPLPATTPKGFAYCPYGVQWFKRQNRFDKTPKFGDVVFYDWRGDGVSDHVGIVEKVLSGNQIVAIEGNTSDANDSDGGGVMRRTRNMNTVQGFGHPAYNAVATVPRSTSLATKHPVWNRYIALASPNTTGADVALWQQQMIVRGWKIFDKLGVFGESSHKVLRQFQAEKGLQVDGVLGAISWNTAWEAPLS